MIDNISLLACRALCSSAVLRRGDDAWLPASAVDLPSLLKRAFFLVEETSGKLPVTFQVSHKTSSWTVDARAPPLCSPGVLFSLIRTASLCKCPASLWDSGGLQVNGRRWKAPNKAEWAALVIRYATCNIGLMYRGRRRLDVDGKRQSVEGGQRRGF